MILIERKKVLVVEDWKIIRDPLAQELSRKGYEVVTASTLEEAEEACRDHGPFYAVLMDGCLHSRDPNTVELTKRIRSTKSAEVIIAMSCNPGIQELLRRAGATHVVDKSDVGGIIKAVSTSD